MTLPAKSERKQAILGYAQLITMKVKQPDHVLGYIRQIEQAVSQMQSRIHHWLKVAADDSKIRQAGKNETNVNALLKNVIETMRYLLEKKSQKIFFNEQAQIQVMADSQLLYEVFENLISNAIKYSSSGKTIEVVLSSREADAIITVRDEGEGFSEEDLKKIFGKFQTLSAKPTNGEPSTGIGLFIVKQIVELHQGKIWVESQGKGKGATFFVQLPLCVTNQARPPVQAE